MTPRVKLPWLEEDLMFAGREELWSDFGSCECE